MSIWSTHHPLFCILLVLASHLSLQRSLISFWPTVLCHYRWVCVWVVSIQCLFYFLCKQKLTGSSYFVLNFCCSDAFLKIIFYVFVLQSFILFFTSAQITWRKPRLYYNYLCCHGYMALFVCVCVQWCWLMGTKRTQGQWGTNASLKATAFHGRMGRGGDYLYAFSGHTCLWNIKTQYKLQLPSLLFSSYIGSDCQTKNNYWDKTAEGHLY